MNLICVGHLFAAGVGGYHHGSLGTAELQTVIHIPATVQTLEETCAVTVTAAKGLEKLYGEGLD